MRSVSEDAVSAKDRLIHQLYQTLRAFSKTLNTDICSSGIYSSEWTVLKLVREHGTISQVEMIEYLGVEPAAISKTLAKLEKKKVIERYYNKTGRGKIIALTAEGLRLYEALDAVVSRHRQKALQGICPEEQQLLYRLLQRMDANVRQ